MLAILVVVAIPLMVLLGLYMSRPLAKQFSYGRCREKSH